jgi:hypothetical protein
MDNGRVKCYFFPRSATALSRSGSPHYRGFRVTLRQWLLPHNTQHLQKTDMHVPGGIWTHNSSKRAAADPRLRSCVHWDLLLNVTVKETSNTTYSHWLFSWLALHDYMTAQTWLMGVLPSDWYVKATPSLNTCSLQERYSVKFVTLFSCTFWHMKCLNISVIKLSCRYLYIKPANTVSRESPWYSVLF